MVEHYLFKMFHWYLLVGNFVICFWINLVFKIAFDTCSVFDWSACFGSIVFICYVVSAWTSSQLVLILSLIFGWTLSIQDVSLISFGRKFCYLFLDQFGFQDCSFDLICLFWVNSFYLLCCFSMNFFSIGIDIKFDIWLNIIYSRCFIDIVW